MRARVFLFVFLSIVSVPLFSQRASMSGGSIAYAGHVIGGTEQCSCGCRLCVCDPNEPPIDCGGGNRATTQNNATDYSGFTAIALLAFVFWLRLRA